MTAVATLKPCSPDALIDLLLRQAACLDALVALGERQVTLAEEGRLESLETTLPGRARLVEQLTLLGKEADASRAQVDALLTALDDDDRRVADGLGDRIAASHQLAMRQDRRLRELFERSAGRISSELKQSWNAGRMLGAYRAPQSAEDANRFTDQRG